MKRKDKKNFTQGTTRTVNKVSQKVLPEFSLRTQSLGTDCLVLYPRHVFTCDLKKIS